MKRRFLSHKNNKNIISNNNYFTIELLEPDLYIVLNSFSGTCYYSIDGYDSWKELVPNEAIFIKNNHIISFRGNLTPTSSNGIGTFTISKKCNMKGNVMSLLYGDDFIDKTDLTGKSYAFYKLFYNCPNIIDASELVLPATTLASNCYDNMFYGCTGLTTAPALPAITLASKCYYNMFYGTNVLPDCSNIDFTNHNNGGLSGLFAGTKVTDNDLYNILPINPNTGKYWLPDTTLASNCYNDMFVNCKSLTTAPELPATTLSYSCYSNMFSGCTSLTTAPTLPATKLAKDCYYSMFDGCTSLTTAPALPATTLESSCYYSMFDGCTKLTTAPALPATTLVGYCYYSMFHGCRKLNYIKMLATDISASDCLRNWVSGVASTGTFIKHPDMTSLPSGVSGIPNGWTVEDNVEKKN